MNYLNNKIIKLVTHDGSFHADDVFAAAALSLLLEKRGQKFKIIRTRDEKLIQTGDYVFDVGGIYSPAKNRFDHHQRGFKEKRKSGITYSSFGLVWRKYGKEICSSTDIASRIERLLVEQIDATDNGINIWQAKTTHVFNYDISAVTASYLPTWGEKETPGQFRNAVEFAKLILKKEIKQFKALLKIIKIIKDTYDKSKNKKILVIERDIPRYLVDVASNAYKNVTYIIFKDEKHWKILAVREKPGIFKNKKDFPESWAGLSGKDLQKVSGVNDAIFCHRKLFLCVVKSKEGALKLANLALKSKN